MSMQKEPLVSIVVPIYKTEAYLNQCVQSLLRQTYPGIEVLLVDDGSPDGCPALCDAYARADSRIRVIHKPNGGISSSRDAGIRAASGEYLMIVDSDDWIEPDTVEHCVAAALRDNAQCVMFSYLKEYASHSIPNYLFDGDFSLDEARSETLVHQRIVGMGPGDLDHPERVDSLSSTCMKLYRTGIARKGRIVSERIIGTSDDTIFNIYALDGCRVSYIHRCFYHYRKTNAQSITMSYKSGLVEQWDEAHRIFLEYIEESGKAGVYMPLFMNRVACGLIGLGLNEVLSSTGIWQQSRRLRETLKKPLYAKSVAQLDISPCPLKWKVFFLLCKANATLALAVLLHIMNYLRSRMAG